MLMRPDPGCRPSRAWFVAATFTLLLLIILKPLSDTNLAALSRVVEVTTPSPEPATPDPNSPNLQPPSQSWSRDQLHKAMSFLYWEYKAPNDWLGCTPRTYFFPRINTIFTGIPKSGCTNWLLALLTAEGHIKHEVDPADIAWVHSAGYTDPFRVRSEFGGANLDTSALDKAFSFAVVRNPWTRLVSAFRQKLSSEETQGGTFRAMGYDIVREMRGITDPDVLLYTYPTFREYAGYLINREGMINEINRHFAPQTNELCIPYALYDMVVPIEHSAALSQEVWNKINVSETSLFGSYDKVSDPRLQSSALYAKKWLAGLDTEMVEELYRIYKGDFLLMNYSNFTHPDFPLPLHSP